MSKITPIMHLKFDGNANDSSGNGNNGTVYGATLTEDRFGNPNSAYSFDGTNDYIDCGNILAGHNTFTIAIWVNTTQVESGDYRYTDPAIIGLSQTTGLSSDFGITNYNGNFAWFDEFYTSRRYYDTGEFIADGIWHQVIVVRDNEYLSYYLDGENVGEYSTGSNSVRDDNVLLGVSDSTYFEGLEDDVRIYTDRLTPTQAKYLFDITKRKYGRS